MEIKKLKWKNSTRISLVVQRLRICLPLQGSIPGLVRFHMPQGKPARAPQLLSLCSRAHVLQQEKPTMRSPSTATGE